MWRDRRLTYADLAERSRRLASYLHGRGLTVRRERAELDGWESGQDHVALALYNGNEYLEGMLGSYRARLAPFNVNYRYVGEELRYLLDDARPRAMILHSSLAPTLAEVLPTLESPPDVLLQVEDESGHPLLPGAAWYEEALAASSADGPPVDPSPDDLYILYTGGTTGMPKGVLWRQHDIFMAAMGGRKVGTWEIVTSYEGLTDAPGPEQRVPAHDPAAAHARRGAVGGLHAHGPGGDARLPRRDPPRRPRRRVAHRRAREGQLHDHRGRRRPAPAAGPARPDELRPLVVLRRRQRRRAAHPRRACHWPRERLPNVIISDSAGSSETGAQMHVTSLDPVEAGTFLPGPGTVVVDEALEHVLAPGHEGNGWLAQTGSVPLGYLGDADKTARTFPLIDGVRYSIPGDRARHLADGQIELLGRDSVTVNSGGEKIFVEEVERAIAGHPAVADVVVTGRPVGTLGLRGRGGGAAGRGGLCVGRLGVDRRARLGPHRPLQAAQGGRVRASGSSARPRARRTTAGRPRRRSRRGRGRRRRRRRGTRRWAWTSPGPAIATERLVLRPFTDVDRAPFAELNAHPLVVESLGSSPTRAESDATVDAINEEMAREGWGLWAVEVVGGAPFVGMVGLHRVQAALPCAPAVEVAWRLHPDHWGHGYATEARHGLPGLRLRRGRAGRDRRLHHDAQRAARRRSWSASGWCATPAPTSTTRACPRAARCGATCSTGPARHRAALAWRHERGTARRCEWAQSDEMIAYHDTEWGVPVHDDPTHFEFLVLEGAQAGLSWSTILKRRPGYRKAFAGFDAAKVARFTPARVEKLLTDPGIIRNRAKVEATVRNARAFLAVQEEFGSFDAYVWGFVGGRPHRQHVAPHRPDPRRDAESEALSADLRRRGFGFVGPTVCYAHLQATGLVNDHLVGCFRYAGAHRGRRIRTRTPKRAMTGSSGGRPCATSQSSTGPTSTKPSDA